MLDKRSLMSDIAPAMRLNSSPEKCEVLPGPAEAKLNCPGLALVRYQLFHGGNGQGWGHGQERDDVDRRGNRREIRTES